MRLIYEPHYTFKLDIIGYQFPDNEEGDWDSNWLLIEGHAAIATPETRGSWSFTQPCLTTYEVGSLVAWLRELTLGLPRRNAHWPSVRAFVEPNLRFEVRDVEFLNVVFSHESAPSWLRPEGVSLSFPQERTMFEAAASELEAQLRRFPPRIS